MAGVRKKTIRGGKYQAWYVDAAGKRKFFVGTRKKAETLQMAERLEDEHRQVRLGYRPAPKSARKHRSRPFWDTVEEYLAWGRMQGGRGGRPWGEVHARKKEQDLRNWQETLELETLADLDGLLPRVEAVLRELKNRGRAGRTLRNIADALTTFCHWCMVRNYLIEDPLAQLSQIDTTPKEKRRALTLTEIWELLRVAPEHRRLLYETAMLTGLRAGELRSLTTDHLDTERSMLLLEAGWTKNRKATFQPLPQRLTRRLMESAESGIVAELYRCLREACIPPMNALLYVPSHTWRELDVDLEAANIPKRTKEGKLDFAALRTAFVTLTVEAGATMREAQALARHSTPTLTANYYARTREHRLVELVEKVADGVLFTPERATCVQQPSLSQHAIPAKLLPGQHLQADYYNGGGGIRTQSDPLQNHRRLVTILQRNAA